MTSPKRGPSTAKSSIKHFLRWQGCYLGTNEPAMRFILSSGTPWGNLWNGWQNPATGCWGQWIVDRQGRIWKMDDMAMTFHVVSDLHGQVRHLDLIA
jgi:hypothetical protein